MIEISILDEGTCAEVYNKFVSKLSDDDKRQILSLASEINDFIKRSGVKSSGIMVVGLSMATTAYESALVSCIMDHAGLDVDEVVERCVNPITMIYDCINFILKQITKNSVLELYRKSGGKRDEFKAIVDEYTRDIEEFGRIVSETYGADIEEQKQ